MNVLSHRRTLAIFILLYATLTWVADVGIDAIQYSLILISFFIFISEKKISFKNASPLLGPLFVILFYILMKQEMAFQYVSHLLPVLVSLIFALWIIDPKKDFQLPLANIMIFISIASIISLPFIIFKFGFIEIPSMFIQHKADSKNIFTLLGVVNHVVHVNTDYQSRVSGIF